MAGCIGITRTGAGCRAPLFRDHDRCYQHYAYRVVFGQDQTRTRRPRRCTAHTAAGTRCWIWTRARNEMREPECRVHSTQRHYRATLAQFHSTAERQARVTSARIALAAAMLDAEHPAWADQIGKTESR